MEILSKKNYLSKVKKLNIRYWNNSTEVRWNYMKDVINELNNIRPNSGIEIGTNMISLMDGSDSIALEIETVDPDNINNNNYIMDARNVPWNIENKKYDVFVGLQVFEHLSPNQSEIFKEIERISKYCILTVPYMWDCPNDVEHHMITDDIISKWTLGYKPYRKSINSGRLMICFKFNG